MIVLRSLRNDQQEQIKLTAVVDTALCVGAGGSTGSLADKPIVRRADGRLLIPGSQLKGRLRHECEKLARGLGWQIFESPNPRRLAPRNQDEGGHFVQEDGYIGYHCLISRIFGNPALPSRIIVEDLICSLDPSELPEVLRPGVSINRSRHTAEDQRLYYLETSPANAAQLEFSGDLYLQPGLPPGSKALILAGLRHIYALGGGKSAGLGWLHWTSLPTLESEEVPWSELIPGGKA